MMPIIIPNINCHLTKNGKVAVVIHLRQFSTKNKLLIKIPVKPTGWFQILVLKIRAEHFSIC